MSVTAEVARVNVAESAALLAAFFSGAVFVLLAPASPDAQPPATPPAVQEQPVIGPPKGWPH